MPFSHLCALAVYYVGIMHVIYVYHMCIVRIVRVSYVYHMCIVCIVRCDVVRCDVAYQWKLA